MSNSPSLRFDNRVQSASAISFGASSLQSPVQGAGRVERAFDKARLPGDDPRSAQGDEVDDLRNAGFKADAYPRRLVDFHSERSGAVKVKSRSGFEEVRVRADLDIAVAHVQHLDRTALPPAVQFDILIRCYYFARYWRRHFARARTDRRENHDQFGAFLEITFNRNKIDHRTDTGLHIVGCQKPAGHVHNVHVGHIAAGSEQHLVGNQGNSLWTTQANAEPLMAPGELRGVEDDQSIDFRGGQVHGASSRFK